jgi:hypothetical protein
MHARLHQPLVLSLALLAACSSGGSSTSTSAPAAPPLACRTYLETYDACMHHVLPQSPELASARTEAAREALARVSDLALLERTCADGAARLREACR